MAKTIHRSEYEILLRHLRALRVEAGVTQETLSEQLGRTQSFVSDIERGVRRLDAIELRDICRLLGSDLRVFLEALETELGPIDTRRRSSRKGKSAKH
jgi:transcriptional regulator with XRE-family HTH domain